MKTQVHNWSIKRKLMLIIMLVSTMALLPVLAGFIVYELITFPHRTMRQDLTTLAEIIGNQSTAALSFSVTNDAAENLQALIANKHIVAAAIYQGTNLFTWYPGFPNRINRSVFPVLSDGGTNLFAEYPDHPGPPCLVKSLDGDYHVEYKKNNATLCLQITKSGDTLGTIYLKSDLQELYNRLERYAVAFGLLIFVSLVITYLLSARLQRVVSVPILHLVQKARLVSLEKNYSVRAEKQANDEIGQLTDGFNEMLSQIQQRDVALNQANNDLERRVQERTKDLQNEIAERKRAEEALQEQFTRTSLLNQITQVISERQDLESILYVVLRQLEDNLSVDMGLVCLFERSAETLNVTAIRLKNPLLNPKLELQEGMVIPLEPSGLRLCRHGETVIIPDTHKTDALLPEKFARAGFRSAAAIPLLVENKLFGTLIVARLALESFSNSECDFLRTLSDHVALAAHQAQLHAELEKAYNDLRKTQQTVMQQERLKALGQMASGIAHDVNNALSPIIGFADLLGRGEGGLTQNGKKYLQYIKTAGEDIAHIVARLREFYRQRDERETLQSMNLNELAKTVIDMTRPRWRDIPQGRGIMVEMRTDFDASLPELPAIESEVREALTNLILNAVDAIPNGGTITLRTHTGRREFAVSPGAKPTHVVLEVTDTGIGMDEETRKHCLEPFFSTKGQRGTGLGLAMVYGVMERHEGQIEIDSEVGRGTTFRLVFPIRDAACSETKEFGQEAAAPPLRVLCIDDEPLLRELLREVLERDGHTVQLCDNGQAGVEAFRVAGTNHKPFDVVITDLGMPYFDGRQVAKAVKRESPATPVIMLTGWGASMKEDGDVPAQVDGILSKPPRSGEIRDTLRRVARSLSNSRNPAGSSDTNVVIKAKFK